MRQKTASCWWWWVFLTTVGHALPQGAPPTVCDTMLPSHGGGIAPQTTPPPYSIVTFSEDGYTVVIIESPENLTFGGFMLQARLQSGNQPIGTFQADGANAAHTIRCVAANDTFTHSTPADKHSVMGYWYAPADGLKPDQRIIFNATVAQSYDTFWVGVISKAISPGDHSHNGDDGHDVINISPVLSIRPTVSAPPHHTSRRPKPKITAEQDFDAFYSECAVTKLCFGEPAGCVDSKNCNAVTAISVLGTKYVFEMKATNSPGWVAVGLSDDNKMGQDSAIECVRDVVDGEGGGGGVKVYMSWTTASPYAAVRLENSQLGIRLLNSSFVDGTLYCRVQRDAQTSVRNRRFDLVTKKYYILLASGSETNTNTVKFHDLVYVSSGEAQSLADVSNLASASRLFIRLHGSFMITAWIGTASIGILIARYFRTTWPGSTICGKDVWFACHRLLMVLTWCLTIAAFVLIFLELRGWSAERNPHAICGTIVTILCFLQPIGAWFRPHPNTPKRPIFNWLHWFIGSAAHILAIPTLFFAVRLGKAELPDFTDWLLVAFVALYVVAQLTLTMVNCAGDKLAGVGASGLQTASFSMKEMGGGGVGIPGQFRNQYNSGGVAAATNYGDDDEEPPCGGFRKFVLGIFLVGIVGLTVSLVVITALAPIEQSWTQFRSTVMNL